MRVVRDAFGRLTRAPAYALTVIGSLALSTALVGASFAIYQAAFLGTPPVRDPSTLFQIWQTTTPSSHRAADYLAPARAEEWLNGRDWRHVEGLAGKGIGATAVLHGAGGPLSVPVITVAGDWFEVTGMPLSRGRAFVESDRRAGAEGVALVSYSLWETHLERGMGSIRIGGEQRAVIGVLPRSLPVGAEVWIPLSQGSADLRPRAYALVGRLRGTSSLAMAEQEVGHAAAAQVAADSARFAGKGATVLSFGATSGNAGASLQLLSGILLLTLLISLSNVGAAAMARLGRDQETLRARLILGASCRQAAAPFMTEVGHLSVLGGMLGLALVPPLIQVFEPVLAADVVWRSKPGVTSEVVCIGAAVALLAIAVLSAEGLRRVVRLRNNLCGPGNRATPPATRAWGIPGVRARNVPLALVLQIAVSVVLLSVVAVFQRAYTQLRSLDLGYDAHEVLLAEPDFEVAGVAPSLRWDVALRAAERVRSMSGSGVTAWRPIGMKYPPRPEWEVVPEGWSDQVDEQGRLYWAYEVDGEFFDVMGIPLLRGRDLASAARSGSDGVAVITRRAAELWWPGEDPIGRRFKFGTESDWLTVVGVSGDVQRLDWLGRVASLRTRKQPLVFLPPGALDPPPPGWELGHPMWGDLKLAMRWQEDGGAERVRQALAEIAPSLPLSRFGPMVELQMAGFPGRGLVAKGMVAGVAGIFSLILALVGCVGLVVSTVQAMHKELGVRIALGARPVQIRQRVLEDCVWAFAAGVTIAMSTVWMLHRATGAGLFGYYASRLSGGFADVASWGSGLLFVTTAAGVAALVGALGAGRLDPAEALRSE